MAKENNTLSLRDHFAVLAMQSIMQSEDQMMAADAYSDKMEIEIQEAVSIMAYSQADLMIKERNKNQQKNNIKPA